MGSRLRGMVAAMFALVVGVSATGALAVTRGPIVSGQTLSAAFTAGSNDVWSFAYTAGDVVAIKSSPAAPAVDKIRMRVYDAGSTLRKTIGCTGGTTVSDQFTLPATGTYTVTVDSCNTAYAGNYYLSFLNATAGPLRVAGDPAVEGGALVSARTIRGGMPRSDIDAYQFRGDAGERVVFYAAQVTTGPNPKMWLYPPSTAPNPTATLLSGNADRQEISLTHSGIYTLVLLGQDVDSLGDYFLTLQKLPGASADCYSLDYPDADGGVIPAAPTASSGTGSSIRHKSDLDPWQFHATAGQTATVALSRELRLALYAPQAARGYGAPFFSYTCGTAVTTHDVLLPATGFYELLVEDCAATAGGAYTVTLTLPAETAPPPLAAPAPAECAVVDNVFDPGALGWDVHPSAADYEVFLQQWPFGQIQPAQIVAQPAGGRAVYPIPYRTLQTGTIYSWHLAAWDAVPGLLGYSPTYSFGLLCTPAVSVTPAAPDFGGVIVGQAATPITVTIQNTGTCYQDPRILSVPAGFTVSADTCTGAPAGGHLAPGESCSFQIGFTPDTHGPYAGGLMLDGLLPEAHAGVIDLSGRGVLPDLRLATVADPAPPVGGVYVAVTDTTENAGDGPAPGSNLTFRFSLDGVIDAGDIAPLSGARATPPLAGAATSTATTNLYLPGSIPSGAWHVGVCVDEAGLVAESDETNNCTVTAGTFQIGRDISIAEVTDAPVLAPDGTFSFTETTRNLGTLALPATVTGYRLSLDQKITRLDPTLAATRPVPALTSYPDAAHVSTTTLTLAVPPDTPRGSYYVAACADVTNVVTESSETNNCRLSKSPIRVEPDLAVSALSEPPGAFVGYAGATFSVTDTTVNTGVNEAPASTTSYRLSIDTAITTTDPALTGSRAVPALGVGAASTGTVTVTIPATMPAGDFYLAACADDARMVPEGNDDNNCRVSTTRLTVTRADLAVSAVSNPPATGEAGTSFSVTDTTGNAGPAGAPASVTNYRLSLDASITSSDPLLTGTRAVPVLAAAGVSAGSVTVTIPGTVAPGSYLLAACADATSKVAESSETNNCAVSTGRITMAAPDLSVTAVTNPPASGSVGATFSVTDTTANVSASVGAVASATRYRFSIDRTITAADPLLTGQRTVAALGAGASEAGTVTVTIPATVAAGTYWLAACADDLKALAEASETNNCLVSGTTMNMQRADLTVSAVSNPPASRLVGETFTVDDTVANGGAVVAAASTTRFYLSLDAAISTADLLLTGARAVPAIAAGANSAGTGTTVTIPATLPQGSYYLGACADGAGVVPEASETNNCRASETRVSIAKPDLAATSVSEPPLELDPGQSFEVTDTTANLGTVPAAASTTRYRLSLDQTVSSADLLLTGSRALPGLAAGATSTGTVTLTLPLTIVQGSYYIGACADDTMAVPESNESNNCAVSAGTLDVLNADLQVAAVGDPPAEGFTGTVFDVTDTTRNAGAAATTAPTVTRYRLSTDTTITTADPQLVETVPTVQHAIAALAPGATSTATISVTIPAAVAQGVYYLGACADAASAVTESNEGNNCRASAGTIHVKKPDLQVSAVSNPPAEGLTGASFDVTDTTTNAGLAAAAATTTRYRLSLDQTITSTDPLLTGLRAAGALAVGAGSTGTVTLSIPATIAQGVYYLAACADDTLAVSESDERNNCLFAGATISLKKPDLVVTAVTNPPATGTVGAAFDVTDTTENGGIAAAAASQNRYYFSTDTAITTADPQITGSRSLGALAVGAADTGTASVSIPATIAQGVYYLAVCADGPKTISESNENNNCRLSATTIDVRKADLRVSAIANPPAGGTVGASFSVTDTTENGGAAAAAPTVTQYRLSLDRTITAADPLLTGTRAVPGLATGAASAASVTVTIPGSIPQGVYYLGACADATSLVSETDETNNCLASTTTIDLLKADLRVTAVSDPPAEGTVGASIVLTDTTRNDGAAPAAASTTRFRISDDATITTADPLLTEVGAAHAVPVLASGQTSTASVTVAIPAVAQGVYYVGACADDGGTVSEANETNNCLAAAGTIWVRKPDLTVTAVSDPPAEGFVGGTFDVTDSVANGGIADAGASATRYRLTLDTTVTTSDPLLTGSRAVPGLAAGAGSTGTVTVTIPATIAQGVYYLAACADDAGTVSESDEANNCRLAAAVISLKKPDLLVSAVSDPPAVILIGEIFSITDTTENRSGALAAAGASTTRYRLSPDATITAADTQFTATRAVGPLAIGASSTGSVSLTVPVTVAAGTYYFAACADGASAVSESDEANNCRAAAGQFTVRKPDLSATAVSEPPAGGLVGGTFAVTDTTENLPAALTWASASTTRFYLSLDRTITSSDTVLAASRAVPVLAIGEASTGTVTVTIPATVPEGSFYLGACADGAAAVSELTETNNCVASAGRIQIGKSDLRVSAVSDPPALGVAGDSFQVTDTTYNTAAAQAAAPASTTRYRLSPDTSITAADTLLTGTRAVASLAIGGASTGTVTVTIPAGIANGAYYLAACADDANAVPESTETNNCWASAGQIQILRPDLRATAVSEPPASQYMGEGFTVDDTVVNEGLAAAASSATSFYLSLDAVYQATDRQLTGTRAVPGLAVGAGSSGTGTAVTIPGTVTVGQPYYLIACADGAGAVPETDETDNCVASTGTVTALAARPDLIVSAIGNPPTYIDGGANLTIIDTTRNNAAYAAAGSSTTSYYLNRFQTIGPFDTPHLLGSRAVGALGASSNSGGTTIVRIGDSVTAGYPYYLIACADDTGAVTEASETNNCRNSTGQVTVRKPDLTVFLENCESYTSPGDFFPVRSTVENDGTATAGAVSTTRFLLSADTVVDAGDFLLTGQQSVPMIIAGAVSNAIVTVDVPITMPAGVFHLAACADYGGAVSESLETNNCFVCPTTTTVRLADLEVTDVSGFPATAFQNHSFIVSDTTASTAAGETVTFQNAYYLSTDATIGAGDVLLSGSRTILQTMIPFTSNTAITAVSMPLATAPGLYYVGACADAGNAVPELSETNNCRVSATTIQVVPAAPDLRVTNVTNPPVSVNPGASFPVTETTQNAALVAGAGTSTTSFYLSADQAAGGDYLITGSRAVPALDAIDNASGAYSSTATTTVTVPGTVPGGRYYLFACADSLGQVAETEEPNNCLMAATGFTVTSRIDLTLTVEPSYSTQSLYPGQVFSQWITVANIGNLPAAASTSRFYLSADTVVGGGDMTLGGALFNTALGPGASQYAAEVSLTVPTSALLPEGTYYLIGCADDLLQITEGNEANNCGIGETYTVHWAALSPTSLANPPVAAARGGSFDVTDTTENTAQLGGDAAAFFNRYYLSTDAIIRADDTLLTGGRAISGLAAGLQSTGTVSVTVPLGAAPGVYYLGVCVDASYTVPEANEADNCIAAPVTVTVQ